MGFLLNFIKSSFTSKCPDGYKVGGVTKEGIIYYDKIINDDEPPKLSTVEKERIMVQRITAKDMLQFSDIPYHLNCPIHKHMAKNGHPFAYMDLNEYNQSVAKRDLKMVKRTARSTLFSANGTIRSWATSPCRRSTPGRPSMAATLRWS